MLVLLTLRDGPPPRKSHAGSRGAQFQDLLVDHPGYRHWLFAEPLRAFAMLLQRGEVQGYDFNRMVLEFTMLNQDKVILCAISTAAMDDLEGRHDVKADQRVDQFIRLREVIEERASRKFFEEQAQADRPVVLRSIDFF